MRDSMRWYSDDSEMKKALPLRELPPASAWNEAMRRSIVISIAGFFVPNLLANFGVIPQLHQSFQFMPGICSAAGVFSASLALFVGYFHRKIAQGFAASIAGLVCRMVQPGLYFGSRIRQVQRRCYNY